jgi:hypothetical protein
MPITLGAAAHTYELVEGWAKLPAGVRLGYTHWAVVDRQDRVHVFNQSPDAVAVFAPDGRFLHSWGGEFAKGAHGMFYNIEDGAEYLYLADYEIPAVAKFTLDGREVLRLATPKHALYVNGEGYKPTHVCVAPNGDIYVFDGYGKNLIHRHDRHGTLLHSFGGEGDAPGQMRCPHGGCVVTRGGVSELYVADRANVRIQVFTLDGKHLRFITGQGLQYPCNVVALPDGGTLIPDLFGVVLAWDRNDQLVARLGPNPDIPEIGGWPKLAGYPNLPHDRRIPGRFISPHGICSDARGDVYVTEWIEDGRISKLRKIPATT